MDHDKSPELLLADCLKQIAENIESMAKLQNDMNDMMNGFILTNMRLSDSIIFANKKLDRLSESMHTLHQKVDSDITWNCETDGPIFSPEYLKEATDFLNGFLRDIVKEDKDEGSEETPV